MRPLCRLAALPDGAARGFACGPDPLLAIRRGETVRVYVNACPHAGVTLDGGHGRFMDPSGTHILCAAHGATFRVEDGACLSGPCAGKSLEAVPARVQDGTVWVADDAGPRGRTC